MWADEFKVEEVVTNYISNAINHCDFDKVIEVKLQRKNELVRVSVFNTGKPIPEEDLDKVWIKFFKVDKARTRSTAAAAPSVHRQGHYGFPAPGVRCAQL